MENIVVAAVIAFILFIAVMSLLPFGSPELEQEEELAQVKILENGTMIIEWYGNNTKNNTDIIWR